MGNDIAWELSIGIMAVLPSLSLFMKKIFEKLVESHPISILIVLTISQIIRPVL
jgi:hypothetical protein